MPSYPDVYTPFPIRNESKQRVISEIYNNLKITNYPFHAAASRSRTAEIMIPVAEDRLEVEQQITVQYS